MITDTYCDKTHTFNYVSTTADKSRILEALLSTKSATEKNKHH